MSEAELQRRIRKMCRELGLAVQHVDNSLAGRVWLPGWPDLTIVGTEIYYAELKNDHDGLEPAQREVRYILMRGGANWVLWRPQDLYDGTVARLLVSISPEQRAAPSTSG